MQHNMPHLFFVNEIKAVVFQSVLRAIFRHRGNLSVWVSWMKIQ